MSYRMQSQHENRYLLSLACSALIRFTLFGLFAFLPLVFLVKNEEIFEFNKMIVVYFSVIIITSAWFTKAIFDKTIYWRKTPFDRYVLLFFLSQLISTALSIHPRTSIFGYYTRFHGGLMSTISYIILFYATATFVQRKHVRSSLFFVFVGVTLSTMYAFPEHFGHSPSCLLLTHEFDANCWIQDVQTRVFGTFGQPNWLAAYLALLLPLTSALALFQTQHWEKPSKSSPTVAKLVGVALSFGVFATLLFTKSRSGFLGFSLGWIVFALLAGVSYLKERQLRSSRSVWAILVTAVLIITGFIFGTPFTKALSLQQQPPSSPDFATQANPTQVVNRLEIGGTDSGDIRRIVWKGALAVWQRYPLFGSGVETFAYSYYKDRPMEHNLVSEWDFLYNKAHNEELNFLATTGIFGLGAYLALQVVIGWFLFKEAVFAKEFNQRLYSAAIFGGLISLHISNFFGFSTVMVTLLMYTLPALALAFIPREKEIHWSIFSFHSATGITPKTKFSKLSSWISQYVHFEKTNPSQITSSHISVGQWMLVSLVTMVGIFLLIQVATIWFADHYFSQAKQAYIANDFETALKKMKLAIELSPQEALYYELYGKISSQYAIALLESGDNTSGSQFAKSAIEASDASISLNPVHLNFYKSRNQILVTLAQARASLYDDALATLQVAQELSPTDAKLVYYEGLVENAKGDVKTAKTSLFRAIEMKANYDSARYLLGQLLENEHDYSGATTQYQYILEKISPDNAPVKARLDAIATLSAKPNEKKR